jgi:hypothetical protein
MPLAVEGEEVVELESGTVVTGPLPDSDGTVGAAVVSGAVVCRSEETGAREDISVGKDDSSVHVSGTEVTDGVLDSDGPVVAYVRLGTYEPALLGLPSPVPAVPLAIGLVPLLDPVPNIIEDGGAVAAVEGLVPLSGNAVNCPLELALAGVLALETLLAPKEEELGNEDRLCDGADEEDPVATVNPLVGAVPDVMPDTDIALVSVGVTVGVPLDSAVAVV